MKKKIFVILLVLVIAFLIVNLSYDFFMLDGVKGIREKILYRNFYKNREILENIDGSNELIKNDIKVTLKEKTYDQQTGKLRLFFEFENVKGEIISDLNTMIRIHDDSKIFYNKATADNSLYVDDIDYFIYDYPLYSMLSTKDYMIDDIDFDEKFFVFYVEEKDEKTGELVKKQDRKELEIILNLGEGYEIKDYLYVEFIDLIYQSVNSVSKKPFDYLGEFKFKIEF